MRELTDRERAFIIKYADRCEWSCRYADMAKVRGNDASEKEWRASAAYWSGRAFGEVLTNTVSP